VSVVVSNASPLINLARVGQFRLLAVLYGQIVIPQAVYHEVVVRGHGRDGSREVAEASWIERRSPADELAVRALTTELGQGEAEAIVLAQELGASLLLLDEIRGRRIARALGLRVRGALGILARARREGHIPHLKPLLDLLRAKGTWIDQELYEETLRLVGE